VKHWIDSNQIGRRNLSPDDFKLILGRIYNRMKKTHGGDRKSNGQNVHLKNTDANQFKQSGQNDRSAESIAVEHGVYKLKREKMNRVD